MPELRTEIDGIPAVLRRLTIPFSDGRTGYYQRTRLDCLRAAVATACQVPYEQVPDMTDSSELIAWGVPLGFSFDQPPDPWQHELWLGFSPFLTGSWRHVVVGTYDRILFDPATGWEFPGGLRSPAITELDYALTIERTN